MARKKSPALAPNGSKLVAKSGLSFSADMIEFRVVGKVCELFDRREVHGTPSRLDAVFPQPIGQRRRVAEAKQTGGAGLVAAGELHRLFQVLWLEAGLGLAF